MDPMQLDREFYAGDVLDIAPALLGMKLVISDKKDGRRDYIISETEAYRGEEDLACHVSKGRTTRTEVMYSQGGVLYVYLIYGIHWMLNIVTGAAGQPQAVLIRGVEGISGPGRLTRALGINKSFNGENLCTSRRIWLESTPGKKNYLTTARIGIDYAGPVWMNKLWRFILTGGQKGCSS
jgi:DNA-3-methyladenine glycosylase